jgi:beta-glucosidase
MPRLLGPLSRVALAIPPIEDMVVARAAHPGKINPTPATNPAVRLTQMGWEFRPQAVAATVRRVAEVLPGKPIVVTENGVAAADDADRVEFITDALKSLHAVIADGIPLRGYVHWSAFDNFEWDKGYAMQFGLIAVDRATQEREPKPSAQFLGSIAKANRLTVAG